MNAGVNLAKIVGEPTAGQVLAANDDLQTMSWVDQTAGAGTMKINQFPFIYSDAGLSTGLSLYTPTIGDILYDAWIEVDTAWDGTTPTAEIGSFVGTVVGWYTTLGAP